jgi:hypothetical protein
MSSYLVSSDIMKIYPLQPRSGKIDAPTREILTYVARDIRALHRDTEIRGAVAP